MITNLSDLTKEVGSRAGEVYAQKMDIRKSVQEHTQGDVTIGVYSNHLGLHSTISPVTQQLSFPFTSETFWKAVEYVQEEGLDWDEEDEEEISMSYTERVARTAPHSHYD